MRLDKEKAKRNMEIILEKLHSDTDISLLSEYRKLFKKETSLFRRSWAAAWLFMYYDQKETPRPRTIDRQLKPAGRKPSASGDSLAAKAELPSDEKLLTVIELPEEDARWLFISVGKNRRLYPREIIALIMSKTTVDREDIGMIRILDNYSFVQVRYTRAKEIIEAINGLRFRGRTMAVDYAKPKNENEPAQ